jgi:NACalpha-BTF3-like transcription factor
MYQASYPPFGVAASASVSLLYYLYGLGIYLSAVSVSEDVKLRQAIREYVIEESKLLDSIGTAQMGQQIEQTVLKIAKEQEEVLAEQTGVETSMSEGDIKECLETVLLEVENLRNRTNDIYAIKEHQQRHYHLLFRLLYRGSSLQILSILGSG